MVAVTLTTGQASTYAGIALENIRQEYPNKLDHVLNSAADIRSPRDLHPVFYGSYDWHSAVHMHWLLVRLLRAHPGLPEAPVIGKVLDLHFSAENVQRELDYLNQASRQSFERTYGWAWLLKLQTELHLLAKVLPDAVAWRDALHPLAAAFVERYRHFLPIAAFPIRAGTHANSAFGLLFALEYARQLSNQELEALVTEKARAWFGDDRCYPAEYEPGYDDFLSGGLMEAVLMREVVPEFPLWWERFRPNAGGMLNWLRPVQVSDRRDPKLSHLDGLNLSRAWCWNRLRDALPATMQADVAAAIEAHLQVGLPHAANGDYVGTHWLASFALLAQAER